MILLSIQRSCQGPLRGPIPEGPVCKNEKKNWRRKQGGGAFPGNLPISLRSCRNGNDAIARSLCQVSRRREKKIKAWTGGAANKPL